MPMNADNYYGPDAELLDPPVHAPRRAGRAVGPEWLLPRRVYHFHRFSAAVGDEQQFPPRHLERALAEHAVAAGAAVEWDDVRLPETEQPLVVRHPDVIGFQPVERRSLECALGQRIGHLALEPLEARELLAAAFAHR